eukprot:CAMPEP_0170614374 /NCGR_PEP_ID=MMETSP0224-20130122/24768_1 /TAXON_ID=285029 /ORGANISM="Togula jolla, Strain CCCM 725" /LENGTH=68 /DNA_ID=CAMNT_0010940031 /DNA_START=293 /DNA_END=499 /DNA_ORIENTATION=+
MECETLGGDLTEEDRDGNKHNAINTFDKLTEIHEQIHQHLQMQEAVIQSLLKGDELMEVEDANGKRPH